MADHVNDTILNMVKNLRSSVEVKRTRHEFISVKRSVSCSNSNESSMEEATPVKRIKRESQLDMSYIGSPREVRRLRADLVEARNTIKALEGRISHMHCVQKQMQLMFDEENQVLKRQNEYNAKTVEGLENQLQSIRKREADLKVQLKEVNNKYDVLKAKTTEQTDKLESTIEGLKEESRQITFEENATVPKLERKIMELETMLSAAEGNAEAQKKLAAELEKRLQESNAVQRNFEQKEQALIKARNQIRELENELENYKEFEGQAKTQAYRLARYGDLEKENEQLKQENARIKDDIRNKLILEEKVNDLNNRLVKYKEMEKKLAELQAQETQNSLYLNEWRAVARGLCESTDSDAALPHLLRSAVERLQRQEITLTSDKVELESQLKTALHEAKVAKSEVEKNHKLIAELKATGEQKQNLIHRMQKKLLLVSRERDSYRLQLDSYERDLTMCVNTSTTGTTTNQVQSQKERIDNLEKIVEGYRDMVSKLENDLQNASPIQSDVVPIRAEQIARLQNEVQQLKNENDKLRDKRDELEMQLESYVVGHDSLRGGEVLHLASNPLSECLAQREKYVAKLEQDIERLKKKIKSMEEGLENSALSESILNFKEVQAMKEQLKTQEIQAQKKIDYLKSQIQEFRNVTYMLLGYKIDKTQQNSLYKLRSMYAESVDDHLCFQVNKEGDLNLLENEFSATLEDMINLHLRHQKSIPVFLSAITMDLFNNRTIMRTMEIE